MKAIQPTTVVLLGMMGSGKTTVGQALAARTDWPYADNDELVRSATGRSPEDIDDEDGERALHLAEREALEGALALPAPRIVGAAASVVTDPSSMALLRAGPFVVYLRARPETLRARIGGGAGRRDEATDLAFLGTKHAQRDERYRDLATLTIDTDDLDPDAVVALVLDALRR